VKGIPRNNKLTQGYNPIVLILAVMKCCSNPAKRPMSCSKLPAAGTNDECAVSIFFSSVRIQLYTVFNVCCKEMLSQHTLGTSSNFLQAITRGMIPLYSKQENALRFIWIPKYSIAKKNSDNYY
jgi:hypothetical protein